MNTLKRPKTQNWKISVRVYLKGIKFICFFLILLFLSSCKSKRISENPIQIKNPEVLILNKDSFPYFDLKYDKNAHSETFKYIEIVDYYQKYYSRLNLEQRKVLTKFMLDFASTPLASSSIGYNRQESVCNLLYIYSQKEDYDKENLQTLAVLIEQIKDAHKYELLLICGKWKIEETRTIVFKKFEAGLQSEFFTDQFGTFENNWVGWFTAKALIMWDNDERAVNFLIDNTRNALQHGRVDAYFSLVPDLLDIKNRKITNFLIDEFVFSDKIVALGGYDTIEEREYSCAYQLPIKEIQEMIRQNPRIDIQAIRAWLTQNRNNWHYTE